ncbi:MAG: EVE domain-containing protein [Verrucomicrobia bacterium]|nr:EVE domain-containing protein [Verrucomicrobiota bacterium]MBS0645760.1 EVE domain-containing protein [Verrucomicrobiota bacterium]
MYWVAVACRQHVLKGKEGGFMQVCHGKLGPLNKMRVGDGILYYSPTEVLGENKPCRRFTAIGKIQDKEPYLFPMSTDFIPWRRDVLFYTAQEVAIEPLIDHLDFIVNKGKWGYPFRFGCFAISKEDFEYIAKNMGVKIGHESTGELW